MSAAYASTDQNHDLKSTRRLPSRPNAWSAAAFAEGALSKRAKELIAFAVAHAIQCPYCIDVHAKGASSAGASREEMAEALHVAAVIRGGASLVHGVQALQSLDEE
jgi:alkylhydroperoxidase/carboxymuconolactone decarboxylase family protein